MSNILESLKGYITPEVISAASGALGESESGIAKAMSSAFPTLLSGLVNKSGDANTMNSIMNLVTENSGVTSSLLSNLPGLMSGGSNSSSVLDLGSKFLNIVFGNKAGTVSETIANVAGIRSSSATSLLSLAGPVLLGYFAKNNTTLSGLTSLLSSQKSSILSAAPAGLGSLLGFADNFSGNATKVVQNVKNEVEGGSGLPKWLLPLLLLALLLGGLWYFMKGCNKPEVNTSDVTNTVSNTADAALDVANEAKDNAVNAADAAGNAVNSAWAALGNFFKFKLPNGVELNIPEKGVEKSFLTWIADKNKVVDKTTWFNFDRLLFETGKSSLKPESEDQLKTTAEILKAFPSVNIKIGGYTDNVGNAQSNLALSKSRAENVMAELVKLGVDKSRMEAEGYGQEHPIASNDTEEGRAQNRRIAFRVTKK